MQQELIAADVSQTVPDEQALSLRLGEYSLSNYADVLTTASQVAGQLATIIRERKLFVRIGQKDHVYVDGWTTCGAMLGVVCRPISCEESKDGEFVATVEAVRASDGFVLGRGFASCGPDDRDWAKRTRQARRSMAQTRAAGKAMRLLFSWVMELAGYATTPFEEMEPAAPAPNPEADPAAPQAAPRAKREKPPTAVSEAQFKHVKDHWVVTHPEPSGDVNIQREKFKQWVVWAAKRDFNPGKLADWSVDDYLSCCRALNIPEEV